MSSPLWWRRLKARILPARRLAIIEGDSLPRKLPRRNVVLAREGGEDWCVGMICPCGCGTPIELLVIEDITPRWNLRIDKRRLPTLEPSIFLRSGCRSHFWLTRGRVRWCD
jgi:Family of unknown function (DUF6527)